MLDEIATRAALLLLLTGAATVLTVGDPTLIVVSGLALDAVGALFALWPDIEPDAENTAWVGYGTTRRRIGAGMLFVGFALQGVAAVIR